MYIIVFPNFQHRTKRKNTCSHLLHFIHKILSLHSENSKKNNSLDVEDLEIEFTLILLCKRKEHKFEKNIFLYDNI